MLSTSDVLSVVDGLDRPGRNAGRIRALRQANRRGMTDDLSTSQRRFLDEAATTPGPDQPLKYVHPAATAVISRNRGDEPLSPSELEWLRRLPSDPAQVPFGDAQRVISLAATVKKPGDRTLVRSVAAPVIEYHDQQQAQLEIANASASPIPAPATALPALADAVAAGARDLHPHEALARAGEMLQARALKRATERAWQQTAAQGRLDKLNAAAAARTAVHRG